MANDAGPRAAAALAKAGAGRRRRRGAGSQATTGGQAQAEAAGRAAARATAGRAPPLNVRGTAARTRRRADLPAPVPAPPGPPSPADAACPSMRSFLAGVDLILDGRPGAHRPGKSVVRDSSKPLTFWITVLIVISDLDPPRRGHTDAMATENTARLAVLIDADNAARAVHHRGTARGRSPSTAPAHVKRALRRLDGRPNLRGWKDHLLAQVDPSRYSSSPTRRARTPPDARHGDRRDGPAVLGQVRRVSAWCRATSDFTRLAARLAGIGDDRLRVRRAQDAQAVRRGGATNPTLGFHETAAAGPRPPQPAFRARAVRRPVPSVRPWRPGELPPRSAL